MPVRCAQLIETLQVGGAENLAVQIANALAARGLASHLIVMEDAGPLQERVAPAVALHVLEHHRVSVRNPVGFARSVQRGLGLLENLVRREGLDVVQTHLPGANFWGLALAWRRRARVVATVHNNQEFRYGDTDDPLRAWLRRRAYRAVLEKCAATVTVSEPVADSLLADLGLPPQRREKIVVVRNGVAVPEPLPDGQRQAVRARFGVPPTIPLLVAAGRHCEQKNFGTLIEAAVRLRAQGADFRLVIAGDGPLRRAHAEQVAGAQLNESVQLPGVLMDLPLILRAADVFVLPSLWEGLPLVLLEALAAGVAAVGSRIPGISDVLAEGVTGLLAAPGDPADLARRLGELIDAPAFRQRLGAAGRELVRARYDFADVIARLEQLYGDLGGPDRAEHGGDSRAGGNRV